MTETNEIKSIDSLLKETKEAIDVLEKEMNSKVLTDKESAVDKAKIEDLKAKYSKLLNTANIASQPVKEDVGETPYIAGDKQAA